MFCSFFLFISLALEERLSQITPSSLSLWLFYLFFLLLFLFNFEILIVIVDWMIVILDQKLESLSKNSFSLKTLSFKACTFLCILKIKTCHRGKLNFRRFYGLLQSTFRGDVLKIEANQGVLRRRDNPVIYINEIFKKQNFYYTVFCTHCKCLAGWRFHLINMKQCNSLGNILSLEKALWSCESKSRGNNIYSYCYKNTNKQKCWQLINCEVTTRNS